MRSNIAICLWIVMREVGALRLVTLCSSCGCLCLMLGEWGDWGFLFRVIGWVFGGFWEDVGANFLRFFPFWNVCIISG